MLLRRKVDTLLALSLDAISEIEMNHISCVFEITSVKHNFQRSLVVLFIELRLLAELVFADPLRGSVAERSAETTRRL